MLLVALTHMGTDRMIEAEAREKLKRPTTTVRMVAEIFGMSIAGVHDAIKRGEVQATRIGKKVVIPTRQLRERLGYTEGDVGC